MSNQKGFITVLMLSLAPVLIALLIGISMVGLILKPLRTAEFACREIVWKAEESLKADLEQLLALNTAAYALVPALVIAPEFAEPAAEALKFAQNAIMAHAGFTLAKAVLDLKTDSNFKNIVFKWDRYPMPKPLAVDAKELNPLITVYKPKENFANKQAITSKWKMSADLAPPLNNSYLHSLNMDGQCGATIESTNGEEGEWHVRLIAAKFW